MPDSNELKNYLLGELSEQQMEEIEELLFTNEDLFNELSFAEEELIDEYLLGELSSERKERFENVFLISSERRDNFLFAKALRNYVESSGKNEIAIPEMREQSKVFSFSEMLKRIKQTLHSLYDLRYEVVKEA